MNEIAASAEEPGETSTLDFKLPKRRIPSIEDAVVRVR